MRSITRLLLTFLAGFCDTTTFVHMGGIFSAHVTGNFVLFAAALSHGATPADYFKLATLPVFVIAVVAATVLYVGGRPGKAGNAGLIRILGTMAILLAIATALTACGPGADLLITLIVVFAMGLQNALHHFIPGAMTTVMTGTVMNTVARLTRRVLKVEIEEAKVASVNTLSLIGVFAAGCLLAAGLVGLIGYYTLSLAAVIVTGLWLIERRPQIGV